MASPASAEAITPVNSATLASVRSEVFASAWISLSLFTGNSLEQAAIKIVATHANGKSRNLITV